MARTRLQSGSISRPKYDYNSLTPIDRRGNEDSSIRRNALRSPTSSRHRAKTHIIEQHKAQETSKRFPPLASTRSRNPDDLNHPTKFWLSVVFGAEEARGLSPIERADRRVAHWREILEEHRDNLPQAVPQIEIQLRLAMRERDILNDTAENAKIIDEEKRNRKIADRIQVLETAHNQSLNQAEQQNIRAVIEGYRTGQIRYSKKYTIVWAGRIVDEVNNYGELTMNRRQRLERYTETYGTHWLWFESPLWTDPDGATRASGCAVLERTDEQHSLGHYYINQGFCPRKDVVTTVPDASRFQWNEIDEFPFGGIGPRLVFRTLLDSGATFPLLYASDLRMLGISMESYAAQTIMTFQTANGSISSRAYEMFVEVCDGTGRAIIDPLNPVRPAWPRYIGGLCPVSTIGSCDSPSTDENGFETNARQSGMVPFCTSYVSCVPAQNILILGENRNDVLGMHKMPPAQRWSVGGSSEPADQSGWDRLGNPMITFDHRNGTIQDKDMGSGRSKTTFFKGEPYQQTIISDPREEWEKMQASLIAELNHQMIF